ncbi:hypothetical protein [Paracoccus sp. (in: a-proteobacteria)]|uniref:hypothetical protein n=1 Tax=Paracoccus sp. TaxID=267 RepID=UPI003A8B7B69
MANQIQNFSTIRPNKPQGSATTEPRGADTARPVNGAAIHRLDIPQRPRDADAGASGRGFAGFRSLMEQGLGRVRLPDTIELMAALEGARNHAALADRAVPGLGRLVEAVIDDESRKLARYLDLRGQ